MKLIHCADLHLDSPLGRNLTAAQARERGGELCAGFARMVRFGAEHGAQGVLIAGDLFDSNHVSPQVSGFVLDRIRQTPEMDFFCLRGNHDSGAGMFSGENLPGNLKLFGPEWKTYRRENVTVTGMDVAWDKWDSCYETLNLPEDTVNILMLHGQVSTRPGRELIALPKLKGKHIDYLALGHIHSHQAGKLDDRGTWCYPGCPEGRGFDECGVKGFVLLEIENGQVNRSFIPFACRCLHEVEVDVTGAETVTEMLAAMTRASAEIPDRDLVKFVLRGEVSPETQMDPVFLRKMLEGNFYSVKVTDETALRLRPEDYLHDASLKGEFIRRVLVLDRPRQEQEQIIRMGLRALRGEEVGP